MPLSRRSALKLALGAGATPVLAAFPRIAAADAGPSAAPADVPARPIPLTNVRLLGGPLKHAQDLDARYLLALEPDRMLAFYRTRAGLAPKAEPYDGWDGGGRNLTGHIAGHYLSAVSLMYAATGDERFEDRAAYIVDELKLVQDRHGDGYLCALEGGRRAFGELARGEIRAASFDLNGEWAPWYTLHKTFAGLRDAYRFTGNRTALEVETAFAGWAEGILAGLDDAQIQHMLDTEFGGMNEVLIDLAADTGDERWLRLAWKFQHDAFVRPLERHQDPLEGTHGNTQIPKLVGSADRYVHTGRPADLVAASFFWDTVVQHHTFATGGHGTDEYFGPPGRLTGRVDGRTAETCNVYNMLKLTRQLFALRPDPIYADFHERALFNHILGSIDPGDGSTCYMVPVGRGVEREYQNMMRSFTCCVGSGMESHALHGDGIWYASDDTLWSTIYAPSTAEWTEAAASVRMDTTFPAGDTAKLTFTLAAPKRFTLALRRPFWTTDAFAVTVNGESVDVSGRPEAADADSRIVRRQYDHPDDASRFIEITRTWRTGDVVDVALPKRLRLEPLPDDSRRAAILWGPLVLAGDLGPEVDEGPGPPVPVLVAAGRPVAEWVQPVPGSDRFRTVGAGRNPDPADTANDLELVPFHALHRRRYAAYWDLFTPAEWEEQRAAFVAEAERVRTLEAATVAWLQPGEAVFEREFGYQASDGVVPQRIQGRPGRRGPGWFSYAVPVDAAQPVTLIATYYSGDRRGTPAEFDVLVDGTRIAEETVLLTDPHEFFDTAYAVPAALTRGRESVTLRFEAKEGSQVATVFELRVIRGSADGLLRPRAGR